MIRGFSRVDRVRPGGFRSLLVCGEDGAEDLGDYLELLGDQRLGGGLHELIVDDGCDTVEVGGTGQLGIEALSRGASSAVFVDASDVACKLIQENLKRTKLTDNAKVVRSDYLEYLRRCREKFDIILLDPPYAEVFLENSLNFISEIDILQTNGIIVTERPLGKELPWDYPGFTRSKDYKYGNTLITLFRKA